MQSLIKVKQLAERWNVHIQYVRKNISDGKIPVVRIGGNPRLLRIQMSWVEEFESSLTDEVCS